MAAAQGLRREYLDEKETAGAGPGCRAQVAKYAKRGVLGAETVEIDLSDRAGTR